MSLWRLLFILLIPVATCAAFAGQANAAKGERWVRILSHQIDRNASEDLLDLRSASGSFVGFQLRARRGSVDIDRFVLTLNDKATDQSAGPFRLRSGERTRVLARGETERFPETLIVTYKEDGRRSRSVRLEVWGLQSREGRYAKRPEKQMPIPPPPPRVGAADPDAVRSVLMAVETAEREVDREELAVPERLGKFKSLRLAVRDSPLSVEQLSVRYEDGTSRDFAVTGTLRPDGSTPWFDIDGSRFIQSVSLKLREKTPLTTPPRLELHGLHAEGWLSADGEGKDFNDGWVLVGARSAGFIGFDTDTIPLAEHGEGFGEIRVKVKGRAITLNQLRVVYGNGEEDIVPVRSRIDDGDTYGPISIRGGAREIREIRARYRSRVIDSGLQEQGPALVQVWAKR